MSNDLAMFEGNNQVAVPEHLAEMFGDDANIDSGASVPSLSIRGKVFRINLEGEETPVTRFDEEVGDEVPVGVLSLIVLNQGPFGARVYYGSAYDPENNSGPMCFSLDGKHPDAGASEPQASACASCPHSVKGSKVTPSGAATTACQLQRRLAVVPAHKPDFTPLLLRLAPTSAYDPETKNADNGWFGWRQYLDFLNARGVRHTAQVVTKLRFDADAEHPKLLFRPERFLTEEEAKVVAEKMHGDDVNRLLHPSSSAGPSKALEQTPGAAILPEESEESEEDEAPKAKPKAEAKKEAPAKRRAAPKAKAAEEAEETLEEASEKPKRKATSKAPATEEVEQKSGVEALLDDWDA